MKQIKSGTTSPKPATSGSPPSVTATSSTPRSRVVLRILRALLSLRIARLRRRERQLESQLALRLDPDDQAYLIERGFFPGRGVA